MLEEMSRQEVTSLLEVNVSMFPFPHGERVRVRGSLYGEALPVDSFAHHEGLRHKGIPLTPGPSPREGEGRSITPSAPQLASGLGHCHGSPRQVSVDSRS